LPPLRHPGKRKGILRTAAGMVYLSRVRVAGAFNRTQSHLIKPNRVFWEGEILSSPNILSKNPVTTPRSGALPSDDVPYRRDKMTIGFRADQRKLAVTCGSLRPKKDRCCRAAERRRSTSALPKTASAKTSRAQSHQSHLIKPFEAPQPDLPLVKTRLPVFPDLAARLSSVNCWPCESY